LNEEEEAAAAAAVQPGGNPITLEEEAPEGTEVAVPTTGSNAMDQVAEQQQQQQYSLAVIPLL